MGKTTKYADRKNTETRNKMTKLLRICYKNLERDQKGFNKSTYGKIVQEMN